MTIELDFTQLMTVLLVLSFTPTVVFFLGFFFGVALRHAGEDEEERKQ